MTAMLASLDWAADCIFRWATVLALWVRLGLSRPRGLEIIDPEPVGGLR